jgi:hypothetical protein
MLGESIVEGVPWRNMMQLLGRSIARMFTVFAIAFGVTPPAISLLELLRTSKIAIVIMTKRRQVDYAHLFKRDSELD